MIFKNRIKLLLILLMLLTGCTTVEEEPKEYTCVDDIREACVGVLLALRQGKCDAVLADFTRFFMLRANTIEW